MTSLILGVLKPLLDLVAMVTGDALLSKWLSAIQLAWYKKVSASLRAKTDAEYARLNADWDDFKQDQTPGGAKQ